MLNITNNYLGLRHLGEIPSSWTAVRFVVLAGNILVSNDRPIFSRCSSSLVFMTSARRTSSRWEREAGFLRKRSRLYCRTAAWKMTTRTRGRPAKNVSAGNITSSPQASLKGSVLKDSSTPPEESFRILHYRKECGLEDYIPRWNIFRKFPFKTNRNFWPLSTRQHDNWRDVFADKPRFFQSTPYSRFPTGEVTQCTTKLESYRTCWDEVLYSISHQYYCSRFDYLFSLNSYSKIFFFLFCVQA